MAETPNDSKTEAPSPRRREKAREEGDVAVSSELGSGLILLAGTLLFFLMGKSMGLSLMTGLQQDLTRLYYREMPLEQAESLLVGQLTNAAQVLGAFLGVLFIVGLGTGILQVGFSPSVSILSFRWDRLSPGKGMQKIFSVRSVVRGLFSFLKLGIVGGISWWFLAQRSGLFLHTSGRSLSDAVERAWSLALWLAFAIALGLTVIGIIDFLYQRWKHEQGLKMTRQEKKEEMKEDEGDPQIKNRVRQMQREAARNRMLLDVPKATVVLTNPTHLAIAIRYDHAVMQAPQVVAKGSGKLAERIITLARQSGVPVVQKKLLARAMYRVIRVNQQIPEALFGAVAEVLAYVYQLRGKTSV